MLLLTQTIAFLKHRFELPNLFSSEEGQTLTEYVLLLVLLVLLLFTVVPGSLTSALQSGISRVAAQINR